MTFDDATIQWLTYASLAFDAALVLVPSYDGDWQPLLFPRSLCRGQRLVLTPKRRKRKRSGSRR